MGFIIITCGFVLFRAWAGLSCVLLGGSGNGVSDENAGLALVGVHWKIAKAFKDLLVRLS